MDRHTAIHNFFNPPPTMQAAQAFAGSKNFITPNVEGYLTFTGGSGRRYHVELSSGRGLTSPVLYGITTRMELLGGTAENVEELCLPTRPDEMGGRNLRQYATDLVRAWLDEHDPG